MFDHVAALWLWLRMPCDDDDDDDDYNSDTRALLYLRYYSSHTRPFMQGQGIQGYQMAGSHGEPLYRCHRPA
jgi:hypothetical protein